MSTTSQGSVAPAGPPAARGDADAMGVGHPRSGAPGAPASAAGAGDAQTLATLREGEAVDAVFACVRKERLMGRSGSPYLTLELRDQSGSVTGRVFRDADLLAGRFERGDLVRVRGRAELFRDELQIAVERIVSVEVTDEQAVRFLPVSRRDLDELEGFFEHLVREVYDPGLRGLLERLLGDRELRAELRRAPCSLPASGPGRSSVHHAFLGGLLEHTVAVATMAVELCAVHPRLDRDLLLCAALVHDLGKTREYAYGAEITRTDEGRMLGHVELGLRLIAAHVPTTLAADRRMALEHCVLAHHGDGPGGGATGRQLFASAEALALQRLNALDAAVKGAFEQGLGR
ncbi:MAG TPA: HD domain-containing protein [Solirubrobacteraceae bacterium]|jgi:3'-5' exoribonuclease|nr:HD domain-containing protein [Solirubrobacteraceae bacterium]